MPTFHFHPKFVGNSIRANPWKPSQYIIAAGENYSICGTGKVYIVDTMPNMQAVTYVGGVGTSDGAFDAAFNEVNGNIFVVGCGDGVKAYSLESLNTNMAQPVAANMEHAAEVSTIAWNPMMHNTFASASWDSTVKIYNVENMQQSTATFTANAKEVNDAAWCPRNPTLLASASGDGFVRVFDVRTGREAVTIPSAHDNKIAMSVSWNYYQPTVLGTSGTDGAAKIWDIRRTQQCMMPLLGHQGAVRRIRFSPHSPSRVLTAGYDFRVCLWDIGQPRPLQLNYDQHREFVVGIDWSLAAPNDVVTASWDGTASFFTLGQQVRPTPPVPIPAPLAPPPKVRRMPTVPGVGTMRPPPLPPMPPVPMPR